MLEFLGLFIGDLVARVIFGSGRGETAVRGSLDEVTRRHPRSVVRRADLVSWPGLDHETAATVRFVVAGPRWLSFRDGYDVEILRVEAEDISALDVVDDGGTRYLRAALRTGDPIDFWVDGEEQDAAVSDLRVAVGRN